MTNSAACVLQGERTYLRRVGNQQVFQTKLLREEVSACDGEQTVPCSLATAPTSTWGGIEHPEIYPPHSLSLMHYKLNFPLSVYLRRGGHPGPSQVRPFCPP